MPEIIDVLTPEVDQCPTFTVDTTGPLFVNVVPNPAGTQIMYAGTGQSKFVRGDSFIVLSCGYLLPEAFRIYGYGPLGIGKTAVPLLLLSARPQGGGIDIPIISFGNLGLLRLPFPNYELSIGTFCDPEANNLTGATFQLKEQFPYPTGIEFLRVSMVNVPAVLNGVEFKVVPWFKVLHNFALTA